MTSDCKVETEGDSRFEIAMEDVGRPDVNERLTVVCDVSLAEVGAALSICSASRVKLATAVCGMLV